MYPNWVQSVCTQFDWVTPKDKNRLRKNKVTAALRQAPNAIEFVAEELFSVSKTE